MALAEDIENAWRANPGPQTVFLSSTVPEILFGGAAGPGKTEALIIDPLHQLQVEAGRFQRGEISTSEMWAIHFRRTMPRLSQTIVRSFHYYKPLGGRYDDRDHMWVFPGAGNARIQYAHMEGKHDHLNYAGPAYTHIAFDELTEFPEEQYMYMGTRLRTKDRVLRGMLVTRAATNPWGDYLPWVRKRFIDPYPAGNKVIAEKIKMPDGSQRLSYRLFIPARLSDNPWLANDEKYAAQLASRPRHIREALLNGDWYVDVGAFFSDEWEQSLHVVRPFIVPDSWPRFRSCDYGYADPSSVSWWAQTPDSHLVCYRNLYVKKHTAEMLAWRIREIEESVGDTEWDRERGCSRLSGPLDRSCWAEAGHVGPTIAETMSRVGVAWFKGENGPHQRAPGWDQFRRRLIGRVKSEHLARLIVEADGSPTKREEFPLVMWFASCRAPIRFIPRAPADKNNPDDVDTHCEDHALDDARMAFMSRPLRRHDEETPWYEDMGDELAARRASRRSGRMGYGGW